MRHSVDPFTKKSADYGTWRENGQSFICRQGLRRIRADSSSTSTAVEGSPAGSHDDESKPISNYHRRLLQKHRVIIPVEEAIRAEITSSYLQYVNCQADDETHENPLLFWNIHVQFEYLKKSLKNSTHKKWFVSSSRMHVLYHGVNFKWKTV